MYKQIIKNTGIYSIAVTASRMAGFVLLPVYTRYLSPADYGVLELLELTSYIFSTLIGMRIGDALFYYYSEAATQEARERAVCTVFVGSGALGLLGGLLGWLGAPVLSSIVFGNARYVTCFQFVFAAFAFSVLAEAGFCFLRAIDRPVTYVAASMVRLLLGIALNVGLLAAGFGLFAVLWSSLAVTAVMAIWLSLVALSGIPVGRRCDPQLLRKFLAYSAPLGLSGLSILVINYGDRFILQRFVSLEEIGIYSLACKFGLLITYIQVPFDVYWRSQMFSIVRRQNGEQIYVRVGTYLTVGLVAAVLLIALFAGPVIRLMTTSAFWSAAHYVPWIAAAYVLRTVGAHFRCVFLLEEQTGKELYITAVGAATCLAGFVLLIPRFHLWGAVASTLAGFGVMLTAGLWQAQKVRRFPFEYQRMMIAGGLGIAVGTAFHALRPENLWLQVAVGVVCAGLYPVALALLRFPHADESRALRQLAAAVLRRKPVLVMDGERA